MDNNNSHSGMDWEQQERSYFLSLLSAGLSVAWNSRKFIVGVTLGIAFLAVAFSLLLPNWYRAEARVLPPENSGSSAIAAAMLRNLPGAASSLLGGGSGGDHTRYLSILTSRQLLDSVIDTFDLVTVYEAEDARSPRDAAREMLLDNAAFEIDNKYEFLSVAVYDRSPERAAEMANFIVDRLNEINSSLSSANAANHRRYVERRYNQVLADLDSTMNAIESFQQQHGIMDISAQSSGFFEQLASLRAEAVKAEIQYEALRDQFGEANSAVVSARSVRDAANRSYRGAISGAEATMPVAMAEMPAVMRQFVNLERDRLMQTRILEVIAPMYEQARFDEEREVQAVQVVDVATPPVLKAKPRRSLIVIFSTMSGFFLAVAYVLGRAWWNTNHARFLAYTETVQRPPTKQRVVADQEA